MPRERVCPERDEQKPAADKGPRGGRLAKGDEDPEGSEYHLHEPDQTCLCPADEPSREDAAHVVATDASAIERGETEHFERCAKGSLALHDEADDGKEDAEPGAECRREHHAGVWRALGGRSIGGKKPPKREPCCHTPQVSLQAPAAPFSRIWVGIAVDAERPRNVDEADGEAATRTNVGGQGGGGGGGGGGGVWRAARHELGARDSNGARDSPGGTERDGGAERDGLFEYDSTEESRLQGKQREGQQRVSDFRLEKCNRETRGRGRLQD